MREMCSVMIWPSPKFISLNPVNFPACLIHWRALTARFQNLSTNATDPTAPECAAVCMHGPSPEPAPARLVFDWYFHLHHLQWSLNLPQDASLQQTMDVMDRIHEDYQVDLPGYIALFFDIPFYPSTEWLVALSSDSVSVAFGVHPKQPPLQRKRDEVPCNIQPSKCCYPRRNKFYDATHFLDWPSQE